MKKINKKRIVSLLLTLAMLGSLLVLPAGAVELKDLDGHWARDVIQAGVQAGYINGYADGTFRPDAVVTRAQFAKMLNNAIGLMNTTNISFPDTPATQWYYDEVRKAVSAQYINGYTDGTFRPDSTITRQEAAVMLSRVVTAPKEVKNGTFPDAAKIDSWAKEGVNTIFSKGYIQGDTKGNFNPKSSLTRAQAAKIIYELVRGERIINASNEPILADVDGAIIVNNASVSAASPVKLTNCRVLGTLTADKQSVTLTDTTVNRLVMAGANLTAIAAGKSLVKETAVNAGATLKEETLIGEGFQNVTLSDQLSSSIVQLTGNFDDVILQGGTVLNQDGGTIKSMTLEKKANVTMQHGTVAALTVDTAASGSAIITTSGVIIDTATMNGAAGFHGDGTINRAVEYVDGCTYEKKPGSVETKFNKPADPVKTFNATIVPANGSSNVAPDSAITLVFPEAIYDLNGQFASAAYIQNSVVELRSNGYGGAKIAVQATLNGNTVTLKPTAALTAGVSYYVSVLANTVQNAAGVKNAAATSYFTVANAATNMTPTVKPANAATGVSISTNITLDFGTTLFNAQGTTLSNSYVENAVELHVSSAQGTLVPCTASISADRQTLIITPDQDLSINTTYYVVVKQQMFRSATGNTFNPVVTSYFTTGNTSTLVPTSVTPANGAMNVYKNTQITIAFPEAIYQSAGVTVNANYLRDYAIELRKGSMSGDLTSFTAMVSTDQRTITLTPAVVLDINTTYYVIVKKDTLVTLTGASNSGYTSCFSTGTVLESNIIFDPVKDSRYVQTSSPITITFPNPVRRPEYLNLDLKASYVESTAVELRQYNSYGTKIPFTATISADGKTITLKPENDMMPNATYYVAVVANTLSYADGSYVGAANTNFTTTDVNPITITMGEITGNTAKFTVTTSVTGNVSITGGNQTVVSGLTMLAGESREFTLTNLNGGGNYYINVTLNYQGTNYTRQQSFQTTAMNTTARLQEITLECGSDRYQLFKIDPTTSTSTTGAYNNQVSFQATPMVNEGPHCLRLLPAEQIVSAVEVSIGNTASFTRLEKGGDGCYVANNLSFNRGNNIIYIRVTAQDGRTQVNYNVNVMWNSPV